MPAFGFNPTLGFWLDPYPSKYNYHQSPEAYECDPPTKKHEHSEQEQEELSETSFDDSRFCYCSHGYGDDQNGSRVNKGLDSYHHEYDDKHDAYYVPQNYGSAYDSAYAPPPSTYSASYAPADIPNNGISAYSALPYSPAWTPGFCPNAWSGPRNPLFSLTWGLQDTRSPYATLAQNHHPNGTTASLQTPPYAYKATSTFDSPWLQSSPVADSSHKPVVNSTKLTQPQVHKASSDNHIEGSRGGSANYQGAAAQWDEMTKTMTKASRSLEDSSSKIKEDNVRNAVNASKNPNLSSECELLLVSIYNMSTLLNNKLSTYPHTEGHLDVNMLEFAISSLSLCLSKQSQQSIQEPSSKSDIPPCTSTTLNLSAEGALSHLENETIFEEDVVKSLLQHECDLGLSAFYHQAGGVLVDEHSLEEQQTVRSTKVEGSLHSPSTQVCDQMLSDAAEESFDKSEEEGDVSECSLNGSTDEILTTCEGKSHLETVVAFDSDAEDWEYVTSPCPGRGCSVFKL